MQNNTTLRYANRLFVALLAAVVLVWTGCDSSEDKNEDDTARFVGTWDAVSLTVSVLPTNLLGDLDLVATFQSNGSVRIVVTDGAEELADINAQYDVNTPDGELTLSGDDFEEDLVMDYEFDSDTELKLSFSGSALEDLGFDLGGLGDVVAGQSITVKVEKRT